MQTESLLEKAVLLSDNERLGPLLSITHILNTFATASKSATMFPEQLHQLRSCLQNMITPLVPPDASAAQESLKLWDKWSAHFTKAKSHAERETLGKAFCGGLEIVAQRFDLPPLHIEWESLSSNPNSLLEFNPIHKTPTDTHKNLTQNAFVHTTLQWLTHLDHTTLHTTLQTLVGKGLLNRSDTRLLLHHLQKNASIGNEDALLVEIIEKIGGWIATQPS